MALARHRVVKNYKKIKSRAQPIIKRMKRRKDIAKKKFNAEENMNAKQIRETISPDKYFMLNNGTTIKSIEDLAVMLDMISEEDFNFHVNKEKNDFANWINDVFKETKLAESIQSITDKKESQIALLKHTVIKR